MTHAAAALDARTLQRQKLGMKISQLSKTLFGGSVLVGSLVAVPGVAAALPSVTPDAPVSLCGEAKAEKSESTQQDEKSEKKDAKKTDKKQNKDEKNAGKGSA